MFAVPKDDSTLSLAICVCAPIHILVSINSKKYCSIKTLKIDFYFVDGLFHQLGYQKSNIAFTSVIKAMIMQLFPISAFIFGDLKVFT